MRAVFEAQDGGFADLIDGGFAFFFGYAEADAVERGSLQRFVNQAVNCVKVFAFDFEHGFFFPACLDAFAVVVVFIARAGAAVEDFGLEFVVLYDFVEVVECKIVELQEFDNEVKSTEGLTMYLNYNDFQEEKIFSLDVDGNVVKSGTKYYLDKNYKIINLKREFEKTLAIYSNYFKANKSSENVKLDEYNNIKLLKNMYYQIKKLLFLGV